MTISTRANFIIRVTGRTIPVEEGSKRHAGFVALQECNGKPYQAFRDMAGGVKGTPGRLFSPSTVIKLAERHGFARLEPPRLD